MFFTFKVSLMWNFVGFQTNLYLLAFASNFVPSIKRSDVSIEHLLITSFVIHANISFLLGTITSLKNFENVEWEGVLEEVRKIYLKSKGEF